MMRCRLFLCRGLSFAVVEVSRCAIMELEVEFSPRDGGDILPSQH